MDHCLAEACQVLQAWQEGKNMGSVKDGKHAQEVLNAVDASM